MKTSEKIIEIQLKHEYKFYEKIQFLWRHQFIIERVTAF